MMLAVVTEGPSMSFTQSLHQNLPMFQLKQLEEDLVRLFVAGKPVIEEASALRSPFKFKKILSQSDTIHGYVIFICMYFI